MKSQIIGLIFVDDVVAAHVHPVTHGQLRKPRHTYVKPAVRKAHFKLNRAFKVIPGHPYWCRQKYRTVYGRNVQLTPTLFLKRTRMPTGKRQIPRFQRPHSGLSTPRQKKRLICKLYILPETRVIGLYFVADSIGLCLLLLTQLSLKIEPSESKTVSTKTEFFVHEIATQGHSRSFILQSITGRFRRSSHSNRQKLQSSNPTLIWGPCQEEPLRLSACTLYFQKLVIGLHLCRW